MTLGRFLTQIIGKTVNKIYEVDFTDNRDEDIYDPWLFFLTFKDFDKFLEIEGDFDAEHIRINLYALALLDQKLKEHDLSSTPDLWRPYAVTANQLLGRIINQTILKIEYAGNKPEFVINGTRIQGNQSAFIAIRFYTEDFSMTIFDSGLGLFVTVDINVLPEFAETYEWFQV